MRTRYIIGIFTASIIFGSLSYASYEMDASTFMNQAPQWVNDNKVSATRLVLAEQKTEFPANKTLVTDSRKNTNMQLAALHLFSSQSQQSQNAQQKTTNAESNPTTATTASDSEAKTSSGVIKNTSSVSNHDTQTATKQNQVSETYIPAQSMTVPVNLPNKVESDVATNKNSVNQTYSKSYRYQSRIKKEKPQLYTNENQTIQHSSFHTVPTPVYFAPGSVYNTKQIDSSIDDEAMQETQAVGKALDTMKAQKTAQ